MTRRERGALSTGDRNGGRLSTGPRASRSASGLRATLAVVIVPERRFVAWTV
jgi:hypothetical protein